MFVTFFVFFGIFVLANTLINSPLKSPQILSLNSSSPQVCVCNYLFIGKKNFGLKTKQTTITIKSLKK
jgi:hypothetical protein